MGIDLATIQAMANASQEERLAMAEALIPEEDEENKVDDWYDPSDENVYGWW
ncbi:hypothetical protein IJG98_01225 [Candidatus Saccharibacteria bacterium]|nr:hypothetical protein [Candidatus Saccharibacteria bacterium]